MRKLTATLCLTFAVLLASVGVSRSADYEKGAAAYKSGDYATALREWTPLAVQGNADAQFNLGRMHEKGRGVPQDYKTAVKWYRLAAKQGIASAQNNLGEMYRYGLGVTQNYKTTVKWYRLATEQGDAPAQFNLGVMYEKGKSVPKDDKTAAKWWKLAAEQRYANAQTFLGVMYEKGKGVPKDDKTAVKWFKLAAEQGDPSARYNIDRLERRIAEQKPSPPTKSAAELENERLRKENTRLENERLRRENAHLKKQNQPKQVAKRPSPKKSPPPSSGYTGSGFFVSKLGHIVTNEHVVRQCGSVTVGDNANKQVTASVLETGQRNDLALLRISSTQMASASVLGERRHEGGGLRYFSKRRYCIYR